MVNTETLILYIPSGVKSENELFNGFGKRELSQSMAGALFGILAAGAVWLIFRNVAATVVMILTGIFGSVMMCTKDQNNLSVADQIVNKNLVFYAILLYASVRDHKTHMVPDSFHVLILLAAIPGIRLLSSLLGFLIVPLPFLAAALKKPDSIGGGDIKLMAACGFFLGMEKGIAAAIIGLTLAVLVQGAFLKNRNAPFALIPYLTAGCMAASLIN